MRISLRLARPLPPTLPQLQMPMNDASLAKTIFFYLPLIGFLWFWTSWFFLEDLCFVIIESVESHLCCFLSLLLSNVGRDYTQFLQRVQVRCLPWNFLVRIVSFLIVADGCRPLLRSVFTTDCEAPIADQKFADVTDVLHNLEKENVFLIFLEAEINAFYLWFTSFALWYAASVAQLVRAPISYYVKSRSPEITSSTLVGSTLLTQLGLSPPQNFVQTYFTSIFGLHYTPSAVG